MERTEVLIVGAGLAGTSLAWHLAGTRRVRLVEQAQQPCAEASAQNAGMVRRLVAQGEERELACRSHELLVALPGSGDDWDGLAPFRTTGAVVALAKEDDGALARAADDLRARGVTVDEPDDRTLARIAPALRGAEMRRAFHLPEEGVCDAWSLGQGFIRGALRRGARLDCGLRVESLLVERERVVGVRAGRETIRADLVVLAAGAWSRALALDAGVDRTLTPLARHLFASAPHPLSRPDHPWCWIDDAGVYVRPEAGGFLCSPCDETARTPDPGPGSTRLPEEWWRAVAQQKLVDHLPAVADLRLTRGWVGLRTFAADRHALVGLDPDLPGLAWLAGLGGFGVSCAFALGERAATAIVRGEYARPDPRTAGR